MHRADAPKLTAFQEVGQFSVTLRNFPVPFFVRFLNKPCSEKGSTFILSIPLQLLGRLSYITLRAVSPQICDTCPKNNSPDI